MWVLEATGTVPILVNLIPWPKNKKAKHNCLSTHANLCLERIQTVRGGSGSEGGAIWLSPRRSQDANQPRARAATATPATLAWEQGAQTPPLAHRRPGEHTLRTHVLGPTAGKGARKE